MTIKNTIDPHQKETISPAQTKDIEVPNQAQNISTTIRTVIVPIIVIIFFIFVFFATWYVLTWLNAPKN